MAVICFLTAAALGLASYVAPLGSRSLAVFVVGCFYLGHGLYELAKPLWSNADASRTPRATYTVWAARSI